MHSLWAETGQLLEELVRAERSARESGREAARKEAAYQVAKHRCVATMKAQKLPATLIQLTVKGEPSVNRAMLERDLALVEYKADMELVNVLKKRVDTYREQLSREWSAR